MEHITHDPNLADTQLWAKVKASAITFYEKYGFVPRTPLQNQFSILVNPAGREPRTPTQLPSINSTAN